MNSIKRLCITMNAHINTMIDQVENHEAVAEAALTEIREALSNTKYQLVRLQNEQKEMLNRHLNLQSVEIKWRERAIQAGADNHERAIECMRRLKNIQVELASLANVLTDHRKLEQALVNDVRGIEDKFEELKRRRNSLAARESRAEALQSINRHESQLSLGGAFERWERTIMRSEVDFESKSEPIDALGLEFIKKEEQSELESMLNELLQAEKEKK